MSISDLFKGKKYKEQVDALSKQLEDTKKIMTPEEEIAVDLKTTIRELQVEINDLTEKKESLESVIQKKKDRIIWMDEAEILQEFGLYEPQFEFANSSQYKDQLKQIRDEQKKMIKDKTAVTGNPNWTVNGKKREGQKMVSDFQKLLLRAFNNECDEIINKVRYTNYDNSKKRIINSAEAISKLGRVLGITLSNNYLQSKLRELQLAFEFQQIKQEEKEKQREAREKAKEEAKLQKEIAEQKKKVIKEQAHYEKAYEHIQKQLEDSPKNSELLAKKQEMEMHLKEIEKNLEDIDYREANQKAGYVYIISNIGSFGEDIYKIGMTRRLNPMDRIFELSGASVPFNFDVHAMIFSDDAPALEAALHRAFENKKVNTVNPRREFFHVTLDEIKDVINKNFDKTVEYNDTPDAEQFRVSEKMRTLKKQKKPDYE